MSFYDLRPTSLRIMGRQFDVEWTDPSSVNCGECHPPEHRILVSEGQHPIEEADTLLHEVMHGLFYLMDIGLSYKQEENVVRKLSTGLMQVFHDNPEFLAYLHRSATPNRKVCALLSSTETFPSSNQQ